jgi:hypothetical protein
MNSNFALRKFWKQPMTVTICAAQIEVTPMRASSVHVPAGGTCRNSGHAEYTGIRQNSSLRLSNRR